MTYDTYQLLKEEKGHGGGGGTDEVVELSDADDR